MNISDIFCEYVMPLHFNAFAFGNSHFLPVLKADKYLSEDILILREFSVTSCGNREGVFSVGPAYEYVN